MSSLPAESWAEQSPREDFCSPEEGTLNDQACELGRQKNVFKQRIDLVNRIGVIGERRVIAMLLIALDSRLIIPNERNTDVIAVRAVGSSGAGKSFVLHKCLDIYDSAAYTALTAASDKSLFYSEEDGLKHKCLILEEAFLLEQARGKDSAFQYSLRSLISEGQLKYLVRGQERLISGPTSFITTTVCEVLEVQTDRRMFTVRTDESMEQTQKIIEMEAYWTTGKKTSLDMRAQIDVFRRYHALLEPVDVVIPFAEEIADSVTRAKNLNIAYRRSFAQFLSIIKAITVSHQFSNLRNIDHKCVADYSHYDMALQIAKDAFIERVEGRSRITDDRLTFIFRNGPLKASDLAKREGISKQDISSWNKTQVENGNLVWCDKNGNEFPTETACNKAKRGGKAFLKSGSEYEAEVTDVLPSTFELSGDSRWAEGGELKEMFDLHLDAR